ncbi:MAG TPA: S26 family signal peptidase [Acidimicrobiales bacterium]|nr:S26 family signal peptidase [Acidimicrobiales bacterium]
MGRLARSRVTWLWLLAPVVAVLCAWGLDRVEVVGTSMSPTFRHGDRLLLVRRLRRLRVGDLVAFDDPRGTGRRLVKRVQAVQGDRVDVVGDNPTSSTDSRDFGPVCSNAVRHLVARRYALGVEP